MSGTELSRVRTELQRRRIRTSIPPHPVQANPQLPPRRYLGDALVSTHRRCKYRRRHCGLLRAAAWAASTSKKRNKELPLFADVPRPSGFQSFRLRDKSGVISRRVIFDTALTSKSEEGGRAH